MTELLNYEKLGKRNNEGPVTGEVVGKTKTAALHWYLRPLIEDEGVKEQLKYGTMGKQQNTKN